MARPAGNKSLNQDCSELHIRNCGLRTRLPSPWTPASLTDFTPRTRGSAFVDSISVAFVRRPDGRRPVPT